MSFLPFPTQTDFHVDFLVFIFTITLYYILDEMG